MKKMMLALLVICCMFFFIGQQTGQGADVYVKVGSMMPLSGPGAAWGLPISRSMEIYLEMINEAGGVKVKGTNYKFKFICEDDKYKASVARSAAEKLISSDKIDVILGPWASAPIIGFKDLTNEKRIISIVNGAAPLIGNNYPYLFQIAPIFAQRWATLRVLKKMYGDKIKKVALLAPNDETGTADRDSGMVTTKDLGIEMVIVKLYERGTKDFTPFLTAILAKEPDVIHGTGSPGEFALIIKQARELGYKGIIASQSGAPDIEPFIEIAGYDAVQGFVCLFEEADNPAYTQANRKKMEEIKSRYLKKHGPPFRPVGWRLCTTIDLFLQALMRTDSLDSEKVRIALETSEFDTLLGKGKFEGRKTYGVNHLFTFPISVGHVKGKEIVYLGDSLYSIP